MVSISQYLPLQRCLISVWNPMNREAPKASPIHQINLKDHPRDFSLVAFKFQVFQHFRMFKHLLRNLDSAVILRTIILVIVVQRSKLLYCSE